MWPPPKPTGHPVAVAPKKTEVETAKIVAKEVSPFKNTLDNALLTTAGKFCSIMRHFNLCS